MKNLYFFFIIFSTSYISLQSQQQISTFVSENSETKQIVKKINNKNYLISIFQNDEIRIFEIINKDSTKLLHENHFQGLYENGGMDIKIWNDKIIFDVYSGFIIYNYVTDKFIKKEFNYPISYFIYDFPTDEDFVLIVKVKDTLIWNRYIIDFDGNILYNLPNQNVIARNNENLVFYDYEYVNKKYTYTYYNYLNNKIDTIFTCFDCFTKLALGDDFLWYQDGNNKLIQYDYETGSKTEFLNVTPHDGKYHYVYEFDNKLYLYNYNRNSYDDNHMYVQIFNIETKDKLKEIIISDIGRLNYKNQFYVFNDNIVMTTDDGFGNILIINTNTNDYTNYEMYNDLEKIQILEDGKILNFDVRWNEGYIFELIDINSQSSQIIEGNYEIISEKLDFIKIGSNYLASTFYNYDLPAIFQVNIDSLKYFPGYNLDKTNTGFESKSKIIEIDNKLLVLADNLYKLNEDTLEQINSSDIYKGFYNKYSIQNDKVYFSEYKGSYPDQYFYLYSYDNEQVKTEMKISTYIDFGLINVKEYFDEGDYIYFTSTFDLYRYDKTQKTYELIERLDNIIFDMSSLKFKDDYIYYINDGLKFIYNNGTPQYIQQNEDFHSEIIEFDNRLFYLRENGFYEISGENITPIIENPELNFGRSSKTIDKEFKNILFSVSNEGLYHFDKNNIYQVMDTTINYAVLQGIGENFVIKIYEDNSNFNYKFYDCVTHSISNISSEINDKHFINAFKFKNDTILLAKDYINPNNTLYIYKATESFSHLELLKELFDVGKLSDAGFKNFGNEGLLYTGDLILLMDENLNFYPLGQLKGDNKHSEIIEKNGDLYFLAIDAENGRQLYKTTLFSHRNPDKTNNIITHKIKIFPNPALNYILVKNIKSDEKLSYSIYDINGKKIKNNSFINELIDISDIKNGMYFLKITDEETIYIGKFIK